MGSKQTGSTSSAIAKLAQTGGGSSRSSGTGSGSSAISKLAQKPNQNLEDSIKILSRQMAKAMTSPGSKSSLYQYTPYQIAMQKAMDDAEQEKNFANSGLSREEYYQQTQAAATRAGEKSTGMSRLYNPNATKKDEAGYDPFASKGSNFINNWYGKYVLNKQNLKEQGAENATFMDYLTGKFVAPTKEQRTAAEQKTADEMARFNEDPSAFLEELMIDSAKANAALDYATRHRYDDETAGMMADPYNTWRGITEAKNDAARANEEYEEYIRGEKESADEAFRHLETGHVTLAPDLVEGLRNANEKFLEGRGNITGRIEDRREYYPQEGWTDEQRRVHGYLYATDRERANQYAMNINQQLNYWAGKAKAEEITEDGITKGEWAKAQGARAASGVDYLLNVMEYNMEGAVSGNPHITNNNQVASFNQIANAVDTAISNKWNGYDETTGTYTKVLDESIPVVGGKGWGDAYQLGMSILQSTLAGATGEVGTYAIFFGSAAQSAYEEAMERGATQGQALTLGALNGIAEGLFEAASIDKVKSLAGMARDRSTVLAWLRAIGISGFIEGSEELNTGIADLIIDAAVMSGNSQTQNAIRSYMAQGLSYDEAWKKAFMGNLNDLAYDALGGAISGAVHGNLFTAVGKGWDAITTYQGDARTLMQEAAEAGVKGAREPGAHENVRLSNAQAKKLQAGLVKNAGGEENYAKQRAAKAETDYKQAEQDYKIVRNALESLEMLNDDQTAALLSGFRTGTASAQDYAEGVRQAFTAGRIGLSLEQAREQFPDTRLNRKQFENAFNAGHKNQTPNIQGAKAKIDGKDYSIRMKGSDTVVFTTANGKTIEMPRTEALTREGVTMPAEVVQLMHAVEQFGENAGEIYNLYTGNMGIDSYAAAMNSAIHWAESGVLRERIESGRALGQRTNLTRLTDEQIALAEKIGEARRAERKASAKARSESFEKKTVKPGKYGRVITNGAVTARGEKLKGIDFKNLNKQQKDAVKAIRAFANLVKIDYVIYDGVRAGTNTEGTEAEKSWGFYEDGRIYLNINAGTGNDYIAVATLAHELTHFMQDFAAEEYGQLKDEIVKIYYNNDPAEFERIVDLRMRTGGEEGKTLSYDAAVDEVIANSCMEMLNDSKAIDQLCADNPTLGQKILNVLKQLISDIFGDINHIPFQENAFYRAHYNAFNNAQNLFAAGLKKAAENAQKGEAAEGTRQNMKYDENKSGKEETITSYENLPADAYYTNGRIYDYDFLVAQKPMTVETLPHIQKGKTNNETRDAAVAAGIENAASVGRKVSETESYVKNDYTEREILIGKSGLEHGLGGRDPMALKTNTRIASIAGFVVKNGIPINGLVTEKESKQVLGTYALATLLKSEMQWKPDSFFVAISTIEQVGNSLENMEVIDVTHALSGRIERDGRAPRVGPGSTPVTSISSISIADFLDIVNETHRSILSNNVLEHYGEERPTDGYYNGKTLFQKFDSPDAMWTEETLKDHIEYNKYGAKRSAAFAARMRLDDFLNLTTNTDVNKTRKDRIINSAREYGELDTERLSRNEERWAGIHLEIDSATGRVEGHEGRHRAAMMMDAGVETAPILIVDRAHRYEDRTKLNTLTLRGQEFNEEPNSNTVELTDVIPLIAQYQDELIEKFAGNQAGTLRYQKPGGDEEYVGRYERAAREAETERKPENVDPQNATDEATYTEDGKTYPLRQYSLKSMDYDVQDGKMFDDLATYTGMSEQEIDDLRNGLTHLMDVIALNRDILDMNETYGKENRPFKPFKPNSDPLYTLSLDFSTLCRKRLMTQYVIEKLQTELTDSETGKTGRALSAEEQLAVRDLMKEYGKQEKALKVACAMCYVEAARLKAPKQINKFLRNPESAMLRYFALKNKEFNDSVKQAQAEFKVARGYAANTAKKDMKPADVTALNKMSAKLRDEYGSKAHPASEEELEAIRIAKSLPNSTFLTAANLARLAEEHPLIYDAYTATIRTATRSKSLEADIPYYYGDSRGVVSDEFIQNVNAENGMRFSSWSDFQIEHMLDMMTAVIELSTRKCSMHGYTKFLEQVRIFGKTGMMFNMSGVPQGTGLKADGSLDFSPTESVLVHSEDGSEYDAIRAREEFPETAGLQCIGIGNEHIFALLASDIIDYVIPYHTSGLNASLRRMAQISNWADFTSFQNAAEDKSIKFDEKIHDKETWHKEPVFSEFFNAAKDPANGYKEGEQGIVTMRRAADIYKKMCAERGLKPKFSWGNSKVDADFSNDPNYWKLLIDRKMINQRTGALIEQKAVTPTFDFGLIEQMVKESVDAYDSTLQDRALSYVREHIDELPKRISDLKKSGAVKKAKADAKKADDLSKRFNELQAGVVAAATEGSVKQAEADEQKKRAYQKYDGQISFDDMSDEYTRSQWNTEYRQRVETAEELTERAKDYLTQRGVDPEELEEYGARESYFNRSGDIAGASDMLRMISDLSKEMSGREKTEAYELMEELLAHAESEALGLYTTNEDPRNPDFAEWYNKRNPSLYYPGYTPGDLFYSYKMDQRQIIDSRDNREKETRYLKSLLKRENLTAEFRADAEDFLKRLNEERETFYQKYNPAVEETAEERDSRKAAEIRAREEKQLLHETVVSLNRELKKLNWKLSGGNEVREDDCLKLAREYKKTYGSTVNTQELAGDIKALGDYIVSAEELDDEKIRKAAEAIAYKLIESAREVEDMWSMRNQDLERHQAAASWIQGKKFYFPENLRGDLAREGGYNAFRRANMGRFTLSSKDGDSIDALYTELHDTYPDLFPELTNEGDQIIRMAEIFEEAKPDMVNPYAYEDESFLTEVANGIYEDVLGEGIRQKAPSLMARVNLTEADIESEAPALSGEELAKVQKDLATISKELEAATTKASALEKRWETVSANEALAQKKLAEAEDRIQRLSDMLRTESLNGKLTAQQRLDAQNSLKKALAEKAKLEKLLKKAKDNTALVRQERNEIRKGRREAELKRDSLQRQLNRETARNAVLKGKLSDNAQRTRDRLAALRAEKNARIAQIRAEGAAKVEEVRATEKAEKWARVASERERYQNMARRARERRIEAQTRGTLRKRITKIYNEFARDITHPTEGHHIPPEMMKQAVDVLQALNMDTSREGTKSGEKLKEKLAKLKVTYDAVQNDKDFRNAAVYDDTVSEMLQAMIEEVGDTPINQMTAKQMESVYNVLVAMRTTARTALKIKMQGEERDAYEVARKMTNEVRSGQKPSRGFAGAYLNTQLTPERMFNRLGGYHKDNTWSQVYRMLNEGQLESTRIFVEGSKIFEKLLNSKDYNGYVSPKNAVDIGLKDENGNAVPVTHDMLVSLWMHLQNEDNTRHAILGGLTIPNQKQYYAGNRARGSEEAVRVLGTALPELKRAMELREQAQQTDDEDLKRELYKEIGDLREKAMGHATVLYNKVADNMTAYDRQWAAALSELFDVYSKEQLNKTTMEVYGIKRASVEHYWPINVDGDFLNTPFESVAKDFSIENAGFMKERVNSSKPIRLVGSSDVASSQLKKVSQYAGLMPVIRNFNKIWGKTQIGYQDSLKNAVHTVYGDTGVKYIENLMADLNGARGGQESPFGQALNKMRGNMAQAALTLSMRTAFGQTASYPTAAAVVGWKPLLQALAKGGKNGRVFSGADRELIERYSPLLRYRSMGYSTTELGDISTSNNRMAQIWKKMRWLTGWIQAMDTATVGRLWYAAEYYVDDHNSALKKGTDAYYEEVAKVFNDIVEKTQPDYTTMQRPDILRNPNALVRSLTMFMTQRLQNANIMYDAAATLTQMKKDYAAGTYGVTKEDVHQAAVNSRRAAASIIVAGVTITAFKFLADVVLHSMNAYRDDDKDLTDESVGMQLLDMFLDSMLGNILGGSEIYDLIESKVFGKTYYGIEVSGISTVSDVAEDMSKLFDKIRESGFKVGEYTKELNNMAKDVAQLLGIPLSNAEKIVMGIVNHGKDIANGEFGSFEAGVERKTSQNGHRLYRAYAEGDAKKVEKIRAEVGEDQSTLNQNLAGYIKDLYKEGEITEEEAKKQLIDYAEVGKYTAAEAISKINFEKDFGFKFDDLKDRYLAGDMTSVETRNALVRYGGKTTESAKETVEGWKEKYDFDKRYGTEYEKYDLSFAGAKQYYLNYRSETTLEKFADQWKKYGATAVKNYYKNGWKNTGLTIEQYNKYGVDAPIYGDAKTQAAFSVWNSTLKPGGMTIERFMAFLKSADLDSNNSLKQDELGKALKAAIANGEMDYSDAEALWGSQGWKSSFKTWSKKKHK